MNFRAIPRCSRSTRGRGFAGCRRKPESRSPSPTSTMPPSTTSRAAASTGSGCLSVWRTGAASRAVSRGNPAWQAEFRPALPDLTEDDICGSGFAIGAYEVDEALGGKAALAAFRARLAARGLRLMLDFVPNHTALDHPWVKTHPDFYIRAASRRSPRPPGNYYRVETARARASWPMGAIPISPAGRTRCSSTTPIRRCRRRRWAELATIAGQCDGVRCDMAMLLLPEVFQRTWGLTPAPFWPKAIAAVRRSASRLHVPGRGLLGPRMGTAAAGLRLLLRQAAVRSPSPCRCRRHSRPSGGRARLSGSAGALPRESRRAARGGDLPLAAASGGRHRHVLCAGPALLPSGPARGRAGAACRCICAAAPVEPPNADIAAFYDRLLSVLMIRRPFAMATGR